MCIRDRDSNSVPRRAAPKIVLPRSRSARNFPFVVFIALSSLLLRDWRRGFFWVCTGWGIAVFCCDLFHLCLSNHVDLLDVIRRDEREHLVFQSGRQVPTREGCLKL